MKLESIKLVVISHAGIKQINRAVYRSLKLPLKELRLIIPSSLILGSGKRIDAEPALPDDPEIVPLALSGRNPRTYFYPELISWLDKNKPEVVLLENDPVSKLGVQLARWCKKNNAKLICQTYENLRRDVGNTLKRQGWRAVVKNLVIEYLNYRMARKIDALLVVNRDSELIFNDYGYRNVFLIPLGYDPHVFFPDEEKKKLYRNALAIDEGCVLIAYFGRLVPQKGVHLLIEALSDLKSLNWMLLLDHIHDSEDNYVSTIQALIRERGLENRVRYFDADHFEIANYMRASDITVAPSITTTVFKEQYGRAVQEAMACGSVVMVSDSGHLKDLVGEKQLVFKEGDIAMMKELLERLVMNKTRRVDYSSFLRARAVNGLTIQIQSQRLLELMQQMD